MPREKPTKAQERRAKKDRVIEAARDLVRTGVKAPATAAPRENENRSVDGAKLGRVRDALQELDR